MNEPSIIGLSPKKPSNQFIPLWLLCIRVLSNNSNIKVSFKENKEEIINIELELQSKIINKFKNKSCYYNLDWILLITENTTHLIENEYSERFFNFFYYLLRAISNLSEKNSKVFFGIIKDFIFNIFDTTYEKGIEYTLKNNKDIFELPNILTKKMNKLIEKEFNLIVNGI